MTLVVSVATPHYVIQVSDRRLVWLRNGAIVRADDERNKAVFWRSRLIFAYTGLAELGRERRTDLWLAHQLSEIEGQLADTSSAGVGGAKSGDQRSVLVSLSERATAYFRGPRISRLDAALRRHAFVAAGWARFEGEADFSPYLAFVSNFHDQNGRETAAALDQFSLALRRLAPGQGGTVVPIGHRFTTAELDQLTADLAAAAQSPMDVLGVLAKAVREVASRSDVVGRGLMANVLPRGAIRAGQAEHFTLLGPPMPDQPTFLHVPPTDDPPGTAHGPCFVSGGVVVADFRAEALAEPGVTDE